MTSQSIKGIARKTQYLPNEMKWEWNVMIDMKENINGWENFSSPCVKLYSKDIIASYWGVLHSYITCILSMKYITWN